jgi:hypothetical protein
VEGVPQVLVERVAVEEQLGEDDGVLERLRAALRDGGRAGVRRVADQHDPAPVPRLVEDVGLEPGVVDAGRVGQRLADLVPRAVVGLRELLHRGELLLRGKPAAILGVLDDVRVERVVAGGAVAGDVGRAAVVEVGAGHARRAGPERPPDAHADGRRLEVDAEGAPGPGADAVGPDDEVVPAGRAVGERDVEAVVVLGELGERRPEADLDAHLGRAVDQDPGEVGPRHAHDGGHAGAAGPGIGDLGHHGTGRVGGADAGGVEGVALGLHLVPDAERLQLAQGVALQRDPRADRRDVRLDLHEVDGHTARGEVDGGGSAGQAAADHQHVVHSRHEGSFVTSRRWG